MKRFLFSLLVLILGMILCGDRLIYSDVSYDNFVAIVDIDEEYLGEGTDGDEFFPVDGDNSGEEDIPGDGNFTDGEDNLPDGNGSGEEDAPADGNQTGEEDDIPDGSGSSDLEGDLNGTDILLPNGDNGIKNPGDDDSSYVDDIYLEDVVEEDENIENPKTGVHDYLWVELSILGCIYLMSNLIAKRNLFKEI